jgi:hypothetical protein
MCSLFRNRYRIESSRFPGFDYSAPGKYFITICTKNRIPFFGKIRNGVIILSDTGFIVRDSWLAIPSHFPSALLDEFIIMPDHIHGIIIIKSSVQTPNLGVSTAAPNLGVSTAAPNSGVSTAVPNLGVATPKNQGSEIYHRLHNPIAVGSNQIKCLFCSGEREPVRHHICDIDFTVFHQIESYFDTIDLTAYELK